jgi:hypothetical protein
MENASIGRFCHCQHGFWRFHRQCAFRHVLLSPAHLFGTICHGRYVFPVLLAIVNMFFSTLFVISGTLFRALSADRVDF